MISYCNVEHSGTSVNKIGDSFCPQIASLSISMKDFRFFDLAQFEATISQSTEKSAKW